MEKIVTDNVQNRCTELDLLRIVACLGVLSIHFSVFYGTVASIYIRSFVSISVPLFMSISGYLVFYIKEYSYTYVLKHFFLRFFILFEIWKFAYQIYGFRGRSGVYNFILFSVENAEGWHLWYLRVYLLVLLSYPLVRAITKEKKNYVFFSIMYLVFFSLRYSLETWLRAPGFIIRIFNVPFIQYNSLISGTIKGFYPFEAVGVFIAGGAFIKMLKDNGIRKPLIVLPFLSIIAYALTVFYGFRIRSIIQNDPYPYSCDPYMINVLVIGIGVIVLLFYVGSKVKSSRIKAVIAWLADKTLGVYILQSFLYNAIVKLLKLFNIDGVYLRKICIYFGILIGGIVITGIVHLTIPRKVSRYIV